VNLAVQLRNQLYSHLRHDYVLEVEKCYGIDSTVGKFEKQVFDMGVEMMLAKYQMKFESISQSKEERERFLVNMNELLKTVDLPARTEKDIFWE
jgi:hypothetical protein